MKDYIKERFTMMYRANKKVIVLGLIVVVLGLWVNSMLGCESDIPVENEQVVTDYRE
jgi:hypothetical protein